MVLLLVLPPPPNLFSLPFAPLVSKKKLKSFRFWMIWDLSENGRRFASTKEMAPTPSTDEQGLP